MQKLAAKFIEVMKECSHIAKNGENNFHGYKYTTSADVLERVNTSLVAHGIASIVAPDLLSLTDVTTAKGNVERLATVKIDITLVDKESGEVFSISGLGSGQDSGDKAVMKAQTAAIKYAYMLSLAISTGDDPEADRWTDENTAGSRMFNSVEKADRGRQVKTSGSCNNKDMKFSPGGQTELICSDCGAPITVTVRHYSESRYGRGLCMECQKKSRGVA